MKKSTKETRVLFSRSISASSSSWRFDGFWWSDLSLHVLCINLCGCFLQHRLAHVCLGCSSCWSWSFHFGAKAHQTWCAGASKKAKAISSYTLKTWKCFRGMSLQLSEKMGAVPASKGWALWFWSEAVFCYFFGVGRSTSICSTRRWNGPQIMAWVGEDPKS